MLIFAAVVGDAFARMTGTAVSFVITYGWIGLAVSSRIIGVIAGSDPVWSRIHPERL